MQTEPPANRFKKGDGVRINDGVFRGFVGVVDEVDELKGRVIVFIRFSGTYDPAPVELEVRQIEPA